MEDQSTRPALDFYNAPTQRALGWLSAIFWSLALHVFIWTSLRDLLAG